MLYADDGAATAASVDALRTLRFEVDDLGVSHTRVQQLVNGVPQLGHLPRAHGTSVGPLTCGPADAPTKPARAG